MTGIAPGVRLQRASSPKLMNGKRRQNLAQGPTFAQKRTQWLHRWHAKRAAKSAVSSTFVSAPEPRSFGHFAKGRQLIAGNFLFSGHLIEAPGAMIWDVGADNLRIINEVQGCVWLDDLAAVGDAKARDRAQAWIWDWIARYDNGTGPGWTPELAGRRLIRWIHHALFVTRGKSKEDCDLFYRALSRQTKFLSKRWKAAEQGLARFEALTGVIYAGLSLEGMQGHVAPAAAALAKDCETSIDAAGGIATRNPEELMEIETLLIWAQHAMRDADMQVPDAVNNAITRTAPVLRALRHADGGLARFHGGGRGLDGRLDQALAGSGVRTTLRGGNPMGFARIMAGRTSLIADAAAPLSGVSAKQAHASTCAFELTSGRRPLITNCGSGAAFGVEWRRAGRATASHSTLGIEGYSSSRLDSHDRLVDTPREVICELHALEDGTRLEMAHDGWKGTHGLTHARTLDVAFDGRAVAGEDVLTTLGDTDQAAFDKALDATVLQGIPFTIRFHLHPEVDAKVDMGGTAVSLALKSGEVWIFRHEGTTELSLAPSVYLEVGRLRPRGSQQLVLSGHALAYATRVRWSLAKAQDTPNAVRDLRPTGQFEETSEDE